MAENDNKNREMVPRPVRKIQLGNQPIIDLSNLPQPVADIIESEAHRKAIERDHHAQQTDHDLRSQAAQLGVYAKATVEVAEKGASVTIKNKKTDSLGETTIVIGNSDEAWTGKFPGLAQNPKFWILLAAIAGVVIVLVAAFHR
jgi:hypothetical protein